MPRLNEILERTREMVGLLRTHRARLREAALAAPSPEPWASGLQGPDVGVIAEVKRRSPSAGTIAATLSPRRHAIAYEAGGARAISVLTEAAFFGGSLADLAEVSAAVRTPVLRKDFIMSEEQICEARVNGAAAVLLIVRVLDEATLRDLVQVAHDLGLAALAEVHSLAELDTALRWAPDAIGVNARDLETFAVDVAAIEPVVRAVPPACPAVAESGIAIRADVERVARWGADAVLVGTALARLPDPRAAVRAMTGVPRRSRRGSAEPKSA